MHKLVKGLLMAAPATLVAVASAQAADLPANKAAPVAYVKICDAYGSGFFYIPGTDTCLRVGGYVRFEYRYTPGQNFYNPSAATVGTVLSQIAGAQDTNGNQERGRIDLDARTQTQWGTVQTVVNIRAANSQGMYATTSSGNFGTSVTPVPGSSNGGITMERAYIRFAGLTAGVAAENFTTMPSYMYGPNEYAGFPNGMAQLAYTATFGGGFSATLAAETKNSYPGNNTITAGAGSAGTAAGAGAVGALSTITSYSYNDRFSGEMLVGNVRYDAAWGFVQGNVAVANNTISGTTLNGVYNPLVAATGNVGWAAGLSFRVNLPMIAPGDQINFQFAYANGLTQLIHSTGANNDQSDSSAAGRFIGGVQTYPGDLIVTSASAAGTPTSVGQVKAYQVYGVFTHYWAPDWRTNVQLGYTRITSPFAAASAGLQNGNSSYVGTGANLIWSPAKNFDIGVELDYAHLTQTLQNTSAVYAAAGSPGLSGGNWSGILRLERQF